MTCSKQNRVQLQNLCRYRKCPLLILFHASPLVPCYSPYSFHPLLIMLAVNISTSFVSLNDAMPMCQVPTWSCARPSLNTIYGVLSNCFQHLCMYNVSIHTRQWLFLLPIRSKVSQCFVMAGFLSVYMRNMGLWCSAFHSWGIAKSYPLFLMYSRVIFCGVRVSKKVTGADTRACSLGTRSSKCHRYGLKKGDVMSTDFDCRSVWLGGGCVWLQAMSPGFVKSDGLLFLFLINWVYNYCQLEVDKSFTRSEDLTMGVPTRAENGPVECI